MKQWNVNKGITVDIWIADKLIILIKYIKDKFVRTSNHYINNGQSKKEKNVGDMISALV
jgi:hypothetical protein